MMLRWSPHKRSLSEAPVIHESPRSRNRTIAVPRPRALFTILLVALTASTVTYVFNSPVRSHQSHECPTTPIVLRQQDPWPPLRALAEAQLDYSSSDLSSYLDKEEAAEVQNVLNVTYHHALLGPPTPRFRDNLVESRRYITTFHDAGWTNQVMMLANMIYIGMQSQRTPILPPFMALHHLGDSVGSIAFSDVFNISRLEKHLGIDVLDWTQVKDFPTPGTLAEVASQQPAVSDELGCWSSWAAVPESNGRKHREGTVPALLGLDIAWTPAPRSAYMGSDSHVSFWPLVAVGYPNGREDALRETADQISASETGHASLPDEQLLCFDFLYFMGVHKPYDWETEWSPQWNLVMRHMHWTDHIEDIVAQALSHLLRIPSTESGSDSNPPPYIAVHARHGDFKDHCSPETPLSQCFAPLKVIADAVERVRTRLRDTQNVIIDERHVFVTSDETSEEWWKDVVEQGWIRVDHSPTGLDTASKHGRWYEVFIDAAILGKAKGVIGTEQSTMSMIGIRRSKEWAGGLSDMVQLSGFP